MHVGVTACRVCTPPQPLQPQGLTHPHARLPPTYTPHARSQAWQLPALQRTLVAAVADVSDELCGLAAAFDQVWFVEEAELLALALAGRYSVRASTRLACGQATAVAG